MRKRSALILGATGLVGRQVVKDLTSASEYKEVHLLVRRPVDKTNPKQIVHVVDFDSLVEESFPHVNDVFICIGTTIKKAKTKKAFKKVDFDYPLKVATMARNKGASRLLVISAIGADHSSRVFYSRVKGEMEEAIKELSYPHVDIFRPSLLLGEREECRFGEKMGEIGVKLLKPVLAGPMRKYRGIKDEVVARAMYRRAIREASEGVTIIQSDDIEKFGQE
ncbi:NAD(P)H-binding protein [Alkalihalophilus lindianensis]|uniref:NAD(P)H-binding protein n=1 Tax=Alkalihalophilus lindianensis TaxID=1630542 RepID=A0ABU3X9Z8_9BACI|nr:NAD(P)H-binding protein [Alkalihalophilus lindianensis]MDV2684628.1 NAD(P)H-binding protein [Alkalihalophilus lindianensis]